MKKIKEQRNNGQENLRFRKRCHKLRFSFSFLSKQALNQRLKMFITFEIDFPKYYLHL